VSPAQRAEATTAMNAAHAQPAARRGGESFSSIFLPLNFITGVFGMNFEFMPLLHAHWGVLAALGFMLVVSAGMMWFFRRKRWI
jgi:hypothetical protein